MAKSASPDCVSMRAELLELLKERAYRRGRFRLASGGFSDYYLDAKRVTFLARGAYLVAHLFLNEIKDDDFVAVGGPSVGADPIVGAMAALSASGPSFKPVNTFIVRSAVKDHGVRDRLAGTPLKEGDRVIVVDDVVTQATSSLAAVSAVKEKGCVVGKVIVLVDRLEGGREKLIQAGLNPVSIYTCRDFGHEPKG